ncbi:hypothetical protein FACS1894190_05660 [Spirochaetia bacterium]|nr:hypothetical protein FACS1894190_05660 [Spirochaetia bacterium]
MLSGARMYLLPVTEKSDKESEEELINGITGAESGANTIQRIKWNKISSISSDAKVFIAGMVQTVDGRQIFCGSRAHPLLVIFYECSEHTLCTRVICAGRYKNEYWNTITPYSIIAGVFNLLYIALYFRSRLAYRPTVIFAIIAVFTPITAMIPPGLLFFIAGRRFWLHSTIQKIRLRLANAPPLMNITISEAPSKNKYLKILFLEALSYFFTACGILLNIFFLLLISQIVIIK